jgi:hypothetical protein
MNSGARPELAHNIFIDPVESIEHAISAIKISYQGRYQW